MAEKQLRLTACRVRITITAMLRRAFLFFRAVSVVTTADCGFIYTPSRSSSADAGKSAHRPMGPAVLAWSLFFGCLRQWSRECYTKSIVILHKKQCFIECLFRVYPICALRITRYRIRFFAITTYSIFTVIAPVFPSLEAVRPLCVSLRSAWLSAVAVRTVAPLAPVQFLPFRRRLLQQISNSHLFRFGYAVY
jgi:hypothetical protein